MKKIVFILGSVSLLFFTACQKELSDNFTTYTNHPLNDTIWAKNVAAGAAVHELSGLLLPEIRIDSFDLSHDTTLTYGDSLSISFTAGSCVSASGPVTGKVKLELLRLKTKGDYIKAFRPTTSNGYLLETSSAFFVRVTKEGKELSLAPGSSVKIRFTDSEEPKSNMQVFNGREGNPVPSAGIDTSFTWLRDADSSYLRVFQKPLSGVPGGAIKGYELVTKNLRWTAAERFVDSTRSKTKITAILPPNFTNKNTAVFAVFLDLKTIVNLRADYPSRSFAATNIPFVSRIKLVSISRIGDDLYLGIKDMNDVGITVAYSIKPDKRSLKDILAFLNGLSL
ncbi:MAG: hypothetical protein JWQ78_72 [Sediminibacterium sp.]|nr:hypothetical protein [Sediminibacterium sp.]